jgi:hypothetical protein
LEHTLVCFNSDGDWLVGGSSLQGVFVVLWNISESGDGDSWSAGLFAGTGDSEADYPYTSGSGITGTCKKTCTPAVTITGFTDVPQNDEDSLKAAAANQPISVAIEADKSVFQLYKSGVMNSK